MGLVTECAAGGSTRCGGRWEGLQEGAQVVSRAREPLVFTIKRNGVVKIRYDIGPRLAILILHMHVNNKSYVG